jgi:hypothetical protein
MEQGTQTHTHTEAQKSTRIRTCTHASPEDTRLTTRTCTQRAPSRYFIIACVCACVWFQCGVYQIESAHETDSE